MLWGLLPAQLPAQVCFPHTGSVFRHIAQQKLPTPDIQAQEGFVLGFAMGSALYVSAATSVCTMRLVRYTVHNFADRFRKAQAAKSSPQALDVFESCRYIIR